jgi:hypothetical protein
MTEVSRLQGLIVMADLKEPVTLLFTAAHDCMDAGVRAIQDAKAQAAQVTRNRNIVSQFEEVRSWMTEVSRFQGWIVMADLKELFTLLFTAAQGFTTEYLFYFSKLCLHPT